MKEAVIVAACRTASGKAPRGSLKDTRPEKMGAAVMNALLERAGGLDPNYIDDVIMGCAFPEHTQGMNMGRVLVAAAGWPDRVPGTTINRLCSSGLQSIAWGAQEIMCGFADVVVAGGVENMSQIPMTGISMYPHPALVDERPQAFTSMGLTAENVAKKYGVTREEQDEFGVRSQNLAEQAQRDGLFDSQIATVMAKRQIQLPRGKFQLEEVLFDKDECVRPGTTLESISKIKPAFQIGGTVTAGNSSQMSDAAAAVLLMSKEKAKELGLKPMATFRGFVAEGCNPEYMGIGPVVAVPKLLERTGMNLGDIDLIELNEAFAAQAIASIRELKLDPGKVNVNGGAIALGHPLGCTGAKLTTQLIYEMQRRRLKWGMVTMCVGFGMGAAGIFEIEEE